MGYRDDFYCVGNMIGYTGDVHDFPTVYFLIKAPGGSIYGHITQKHKMPGNVGRMYVDDTPDPHYTIRNVRVGGVLKMVEQSTGWSHPSRSSLKTFRDMSANDAVICAQAIWQCPYEKYISSYSEEDQEMIPTQMAMKKAFITPGALMAQKHRIGAAADARRRQARDNQIAQFNHLLHRGDLARRKRGF